MKLIFVLTLLILVAGCTSSPPTPTPVEGSDVLKLSVSAHQFGFSPSTIQVKKGQKVQVTLTSDDVTHGFSIPAFGVNQVINAASPTVVEFTADQVGSFPVICSVPCGSGHQTMQATLVVTE